MTTSGIAMPAPWQPPVQQQRGMSDGWATLLTLGLMVPAMMLGGWGGAALASNVFNWGTFGQTVMAGTGMIAGGTVGSIIADKVTG